MESNDRVICSHCGKQMVPRIVIGPPTIRSSTNWTPIPRYSVCPFCAGEYERFSGKNTKASVGYLVKFIVFVIVFFSIISRCSSKDTSSPKAAVQEEIVQTVSTEQNSNNTHPNGEGPKRNALTVRDPLVNAAPLGLELGFANIEGLYELYPNIKLGKSETDSVFNGLAYPVEVGVFGIEGLRRAVIICDEDYSVVAVRLFMDKNPSALLPKFSNKYRLVSDKINRHLNYGNAKLEKGNSVIEVLSEHLSFEMEIRYQTRSYFESSKKLARAEHVAKENVKADRL